MSSKFTISRITASLETIRHQMDILKAHHGELSISSAKRRLASRPAMPEDMRRKLPLTMANQPRQ